MLQNLSNQSKMIILKLVHSVLKENSKNHFLLYQEGLQINIWTSYFIIILHHQIDPLQNNTKFSNYFPPM